MAAGVGKRVIKPTEKKGLMNWLGMYFDSRLSFFEHITKMASKSRRVVACLSMLVKPLGGQRQVSCREEFMHAFYPFLLMESQHNSRGGPKQIAKET